LRSKPPATSFSFSRGETDGQPSGSSVWTPSNQGDPLPETSLGAGVVVIKKKAKKVPGLALGAADVLKGEVKVFTANEFCLEAILASGSLDDINGMTRIEEGRNRGLYLDGAWGTNPPIRPMLNYNVEQLWLVEVFPMTRKTPPARSRWPPCSRRESGIPRSAPGEASPKAAGSWRWSSGDRLEPFE